jgi:succinate dehydrogenase / fumarate reductase flavoprotein subunit
MQGLADGYFVAPYTVANYLGGSSLPPVSVDHAAFGASKDDSQSRIDRVLKVKGTRTVREFHRAIGAICWDRVGMARTEAGLNRAITEIRTLRDEFWQDVSVPGEANNLNPGLDYAGRVADYMEFAEVLALDALERRESCGGHFREEFQTPDGEALRKDEEFSYVAAWEFQGVGAKPGLHKEQLVFEEVHPTQRSYK